MPVPVGNHGERKIRMKFIVSRASGGAVSKAPPFKGAVRGPQAKAWPGEYVWFIELNTLEDLIAFLNASGGALGLFSPEEGEGEEYAAIEIFDDDEE
jgi:hypothetical protein